MCAAAIPANRLPKGATPWKAMAVEAHRAAALVVVDDGLQNGVAGGHFLHHAEAGYYHQQQRKPQPMREGEGDQRSSEDGGYCRNNAPQTQH